MTKYAIFVNNSGDEIYLGEKNLDPHPFFTREYKMITTGWWDLPPILQKAKYAKGHSTVLEILYDIKASGNDCQLAFRRCIVVDDGPYIDKFIAVKLSSIDEMIDIVKKSQNNKELVEVHANESEKSVLSNFQKKRNNNKPEADNDIDELFFHPPAFIPLEPFSKRCSMYGKNTVFTLKFRNVKYQFFE